MKKNMSEVLNRMCKSLSASEGKSVKQHPWRKVPAVFGGDRGARTRATIEAQKKKYGKDVVRDSFKDRLGVEKVEPLSKPYASEAQRGKFHAMENRGEISHATVAEWDKESKGKKLPERVAKTEGLKKWNFSHIRDQLRIEAKNKEKGINKPLAGKPGQSHMGLDVRGAAVQEARRKENPIFDKLSRLTGQPSHGKNIQEAKVDARKQAHTVLNEIRTMSRPKLTRSELEKFDQDLNKTWGLRKDINFKLQAPQKPKDPVMNPATPPKPASDTYKQKATAFVQKPPVKKNIPTRSDLEKFDQDLNKSWGKAEGAPAPASKPAMPKRPAMPKMKSIKSPVPKKAPDMQMNEDKNK